MATTFAPRRLSALALAFGLLALASGCSNDSLVCVAAGCKPVPPAVVDDLVSLSGQFCTTSPDVVTYPYKVLFIVDISGSTAVSDAGGGRGPAVAAAMAQFANNPQVFFAMMTFSDKANSVVPKFTRDPAVLAAGVTQLNVSQGATNYTDALQMAHDIIDADAALLEAGERARTRYDMQWLSDGVPNPAVPPAAIRIDEQAVLDLAPYRKLLGITLSTIYLSGAAGTDGPVAAALMQQMAADGKGTFQQLTGDQLKFNINITQQLQPFDNHLFYLVNESRVVRGDRALPDSDHDGIADEDEVAAGTDPLTADKGMTGCSDLVNRKLLPNQGVCQQTCGVQISPGQTPTAATFPDVDADGLHDCEEQSIGSSSLKADSDGDYLLDSLELRFGTNFNDPSTTTADTDVDGVTDADEIVTGTNPLVAEPSRYFAYTYTPLSAAASATKGVNCYNFGVANVHLVPTQATATSAAGDNLLCLYTVQLPQSTSGASNEPSVGRSCMTANLKINGDETVKDPPDGAIQVDLDSFAPSICASGKCP